MWGFIGIVVVIAVCKYLGIADVFLNMIDNRESIIPPNVVPT